MEPGTEASAFNVEISLDQGELLGDGDPPGLRLTQ